MSHTAVALGARGIRWSDYAELTKARLSALVLATTATGFWMGWTPTQPAAPLWIVLLGTALVVGGANALNEWWERVPDAAMRRTRHRPLPAGRLSPPTALWFGLGCASVGVLLLALSVNALSAWLALLGLVSYVLAYTPLKRVTPLCTLVGAIPGAVPPLIGWAAARGSVDAGAWSLGAILFLWQLPHFLALALLYRDDYARAGFRMLPLIESDGTATGRQIILYALALLLASLFPAWLGIAGRLYWAGALAAGLAFVFVSVEAACHRSDPRARRLFLASVAYLPFVLALMALDKALGF